MSECQSVQAYLQTTERNEQKTNTVPTHDYTNSSSWRNQSRTLPLKSLEIQFWLHQITQTESEDHSRAVPDTGDVLRKNPIPLPQSETIIARCSIGQSRPIHIGNELIRPELNKRIWCEFIHKKSFFSFVNELGDELL